MHRSEKLLLYVDDTVEQRYAMRRILEREGYRVLEASTGAEAFAQLRPELMLIVLDVKLPDMSGFDVCRRIKNDPQYRGVPVIQVSASFADPERRAGGLSGGADAYIAQPVHPQELLNLVGSLIRSSHADRMLNFMAQLGPQISRSLDLAQTVTAVEGALCPYFADRSYVLLTCHDPSAPRPALSCEALERFAEAMQTKDRAEIAKPAVPECSSLAVPLRAGGERLGTLLLVLDGGARQYDEIDLRAAEDLADRIAMALQNARLFTSQQMAQQALVQSEKLAAAARLSAAIAHELNNPLASVTNLTYLIETYPGLPEEARNYATEALSELERLSHITRQSLGFYREFTTAEDFDLSKAVEDTLLLYSRRFASKAIAIEAEYEPQLQVHAVKGEIRQVISNLLVNALDAMPHAGRMSLRTWRTPAGEAMVSVQDNGHGIPKGIVGRIFEPFFTTKKGTGTGLGLWVSDSIVRKHGGRLEVESNDAAPVTGTTFRMALAGSADKA